MTWQDITNKKSIEDKIDFRFIGFGFWVSLNLAEKYLKNLPLVKLSYYIVRQINLTLIDQVPVSIVSDISVTLKESGNAKKDDQTGILTWKLDLAPTEQNNIEFQYEVRYPRKERVIID